jgi:hypothetical protein
MHGERDHPARSIERLRDLEGVIVAILVEAHPDLPTEAAVRRELTSVEDTPERSSAIGQAVEGLVEVGLVARVGDLLGLTPPALRAGELGL